MSKRSASKLILATLAALAISSCSTTHFVSCPTLPLPPKPHYPVPSQAEIQHLEALATHDPVLFSAMKKITKKDAMCRARNRSLEAVIQGTHKHR